MGNHHSSNSQPETSSHSSKQKPEDSSISIPSSLKTDAKNLTIVLLLGLRCHGNVAISCDEPQKPSDIYFTIERLIKSTHHLQEMALGGFLEITYKASSPKNSNINEIERKSVIPFKSKDTLRLGRMYAVRIFSG